MGSIARRSLATIAAIGVVGLAAMGCTPHDSLPTEIPLVVITMKRHLLPLERIRSFNQRFRNRTVFRGRRHQCLQVDRDGCHGRS